MRKMKRKIHMKQETRLILLRQRTGGGNTYRPMTVQVDRNRKEGPLHKSVHMPPFSSKQDLSHTHT